MFIKGNRIEPTPDVGDVFELEGAQWRVLYRNGSWLEVVDASEPVEPEPPKPKYFAPSDLRDSFEKVNRKLERLGAQMEREFPFGGLCCRDCEWSGHEAYRKLSAKIQRVDSWRCVLLEKLKGREVKLSSALSIQGFVASTTKPEHLTRAIITTV